VYKCKTKTFKKRVFKETYIKRVESKDNTVSGIRGYEAPACRLTDSCQDYICKIIIPNKSDKYNNKRTSTFKSFFHGYPVRDKPEKAFISNLRTVFGALRKRYVRKLKKNKVGKEKGKKLSYLLSYAFLYELFTMKVPRLSRMIVFGLSDINKIVATFRKLLSKQDDKTRSELARIFQLSSWLVSSGSFPDVSRTRYKFQGCLGLNTEKGMTPSFSITRVGALNRHLLGRFVAFN